MRPTGAQPEPRNSAAEPKQRTSRIRIIERQPNRLLVRSPPCTTASRRVGRDNYQAPAREPAPEKLQIQSGVGERTALTAATRMNSWERPSLALVRPLTSTPA